MRDKVIFTDVVCSGLALCRRREPWHITCLPHARPTKETACGCAGIYTAHAAIELYVEVFDRAGALDKLEAFASFHGPDHYKLPRNTENITLSRGAWTVPGTFPFDGDTLVPFRAGATVEWSASPAGSGA
jgi:dihydroorotase